MLLRITLLVALVTTFLPGADESLSRRRPDAQTRWSSFENLTAAKGSAARENAGAKGHAFDTLAAGETKTLLDVKGAGEIRRMWFTVRDRSPRMLRALRLEMFWDGAATPAVSVPFGDFFGAMLGRSVAFENHLFSNPEGRSYTCYIPMPFRKGARVTITNDSTVPLSHLFYDIDTLALAQPDAESLYFHASWRRERPTALSRDFEVLPRIEGEGRFLGAHFGVIANPQVAGWWGEGEIKMYLDGDTDWPTLAGTGTEDYIGTGWGQGTFSHRYQGSLVSDNATGQYTFYRYHVPDPVYFSKSIRVTMQQIGGNERAKVEEMLQKGVPVRPVSVDQDGVFTPLIQPAKALKDVPPSKTGWVNMYRQDDWSAVALFYLNRAENGLPRLAPFDARVAAIEAAGK